MEARFGRELTSAVEVALRAAVSVFRDVWTEEARNSDWGEGKLDEIQEIEKFLVAQIQKVFSELWEENEALRAKVEQLEDVLQRKAGRLEQELEARVGQLGRDMELLEKELKTISEGPNKTQQEGSEHLQEHLEDESATDDKSLTDACVLMVPTAGVVAVDLRLMRKI
ncbi:hypothetical protein ATANTOWER_000168, partial [Ataeniobius toweri]|nr:hypothetical protein [Ataeniobius toweri]